MNPNITKLAITAAALFAMYRFGPTWAKGLAMGAAGFMVANNLPVVQDGLGQRIAA